MDVHAGHDVPEADGAEGDEAEVGPREEVPLLPQREEQGAGEDVAGDEQEAERCGHLDHLLRLVRLALFCRYHLQ